MSNKLPKPKYTASSASTLGANKARSSKTDRNVASRFARRKVNRKPCRALTTKTREPVLSFRNLPNIVATQTAFFRCKVTERHDLVADFAVFECVKERLPSTMCTLCGHPKCETPKQCNEATRYIRTFVEDNGGAVIVQLSGNKATIAKANLFIHKTVMRGKTNVSVLLPQKADGNVGDLSACFVE